MIVIGCLFQREKGATLEHGILLLCGHNGTLDKIIDLEGQEVKAVKFYRQEHALGCFTINQRFEAEES